MPTIAEILAAKKAGAAEKTTPTPVAAKPKESLADKLEAKAAIDRIDPQGKSERAAAARKSAGLVLNMSLPPAPKDGKIEVPQELIQPADDLPFCVWLDGAALWLCVPCADPAMPPIKILRLPWTLWGTPPPPTQPGEPF